MRFHPVGTNITWMLYECSTLVGIFWTIYEHFSNVQVLTFLECSYLMSYECSIRIGMSCTKNEHSCNLQVWTFLECSDFQIWHYINIKLRYFLFHENTELLPSASIVQTISNVLKKIRIQMIHLAFSSEHSMNILTWTFIQFFFLNYEGIIFECSPKHSRNVPWMLPCPLGWSHHFVNLGTTRSMPHFDEKHIFWMKNTKMKIKMIFWWRPFRQERCMRQFIIRRRFPELLVPGFTDQSGIDPSRKLM